MSLKLILFSIITLFAVAQDEVNAEIALKEATTGGYNGWWISNESSEVFVVAKPYPRVGAFRLRGKESPLLITDVNFCWGIRTWFQEPAEDKRSFVPAANPSEAEIEKEGILLKGTPMLDLQLLMDIRLDPEKPILTVRHGFRNLSSEKRRMAVWIINAFPRKGIGMTPWDELSKIRKYQLWPSTDPDEKCISFGKQTIKADFGGYISSPKGFLKVGTITESGTVAFWNWNNGTFLKSIVEYEAGASYPEPGSNTIIFSVSNNSECPCFSELEHVGPLKDVAPGDTIWLQQKLELAYLPDADENKIISILCTNKDGNPNK